MCTVQVKTAVEEALEWLDDNPEADEEEYKDKLKEVRKRRPSVSNMLCQGYPFCAPYQAMLALRHVLHAPCPYHFQTWKLEHPP